MDSLKPKSTSRKYKKYKYVDPESFHLSPDDCFGIRWNEDNKICRFCADFELCGTVTGAKLQQKERRVNDLHICGYNNYGLSQRDVDTLLQKARDGTLTPMILKDKLKLHCGISNPNDRVLAQLVLSFVNDFKLKVEDDKVLYK